MIETTSSILSRSLDDLPDLPGFKIPPTGAYVVSIVSLSEKKIGDHPAVEAKFKIVEVMEITDKVEIPDDQVPVAGDEFSTAYMVDNDTGVGFLKAFLKPLAVALGKPAAAPLEVMNEAKNMTLSIILKRRQDKEDDEKFYCSIKKLEVI